MDNNNLNEYDNNSQGNRNGSSGGNNGNGGPGGGKDPKKQSIITFVVIAVVSLLMVSIFMNILGGSTEKEISYSDFINLLDEGKVAYCEIESDRIIITPVSNNQDVNSAYQNLFYISNLGSSDIRYYTGKIEDDDTITARLLKADVEVKGKVTDTGNVLLGIFVNYILPVLLFWGLLSLLFRRMGKGSGGGGGIFSVGKSTAKVYVQKETGVTFKDVAGEDEAKESLQEVVDFLHNPEKYSGIGAKLPKGALLVGPPGTGKTLLAKAVAGEAHVPFFSLSGSDFIELYVGVGASRVRDLFKEATKNAPCIIFIDEIDAIGRSRDSKYGGGNEEREQTLNQLLSEMDGFDTSKGILVLGATNRPEILDKALLRPGRFDRRIIVDKPDLKGRVEILKVHAKDVHMDETCDLNEIALATSGAVGADLANMINEAAIMAVQNGRKAVCQKDLFASVEQVLVGKEKKDRIMSQKERKIVSYHEVGHALISALQKNSEPIQKITIVPRTMGALGYVMNVPEEEKYLETKNELHDQIVSLLGGRAAEEIFFEDVTTGAANDIEKATALAQNMITRFGMSDKFGLMGLATVESQYLEGNTRYTCSDRTVADIDTEVMTYLKACYEEAKKMIEENKDVMDKLAAHLLEKETITGKEFMKIFREAKGIPEPPEEDNFKETVLGSINVTLTDNSKTSDERNQEDSGDTSESDSDCAGNSSSENNSTEGSSSSESDNNPSGRWMPPPPGPDRDKDGTPRGRFSNTQLK